MISDVFSDAVSDLDSYLKNEDYDDMYTGDLRERIILIRNQMEAMRIVLDASPSGPRMTYSDALRRAFNNAFDEGLLPVKELVETVESDDQLAREAFSQTWRELEEHES